MGSFRVKIRISHRVRILAWVVLGLRLELAVRSGLA